MSIPPSSKPSASPAQPPRPPDTRPLQSDTGYEREAQFYTSDSASGTSATSGWRDSDQDFTGFGDGGYDYQSPGDARRMPLERAPNVPTAVRNVTLSKQPGRTSHTSQEDRRVREDICDRIEHLGLVDSSGVDVSVKDGEVTLSGTITERQFKHLIEDTVSDVRGVKEIHNQLRVGHRVPNGQAKLEPSSNR